jgi:16S rRNA (uracil1498-N3)-methyltransferase
MPIRLHVADTLMAPGAEMALPPGAARHAQVRRVQPGDALRVFDGCGGEWSALVIGMARDAVTVRIGEPLLLDNELAVKVTLAIGMPANERMDLLIEKATELGVAAIHPLQCERSVLRLSDERAERRRLHWQGVAIAASEQCGRATVPVIAPVQRFADWIARASAAGARLLLSPAPGAMPLHVLPIGEAAVVALSGPEGGLTPAEEAAALAAGFAPVNLGPRVLRADTAPLALLAWIGLRG